MGAGHLRIVPLTLKQANAMVEAFHRHHKPSHAYRWAIGVEVNDELVGAAICSRPAARNTNQYRVLEVARLVTDGTSNACSLLYAACARAAKHMGYDKIQTFILQTEPGTSLIAAGWKEDGESAGGDWNRPSRGGRRTDQPMEKKKRYIKELN